MCLSHVIVLFASRISIQIRVPPFFLGIHRISETQGVGWSTIFSMMSCSVSFFNFFDTAFLIWFGMRPCGYTIGFTSFLMCNFTLWSFNSPSPSKTLWYFAKSRWILWSVLEGSSVLFSVVSLWSFVPLFHWDVAFVGETKSRNLCLRTKESGPITDDLSNLRMAKGFRIELHYLRF